MFNISSWWKNHKELFISTFISVGIGYLFGFYMDSYFRIKPELTTLKTLNQNLRDSLVKYRNEANVSIEFFKYYPPNGIPCKVGINNEVKDFFVAVDAENSHGLKQWDRIYLINGDEYSINTRMVIVQLVKDSPKSSADFFVNKKMLQGLNIGQDKLHQGVFSIHYKLEK